MLVMEPEIEHITDKWCQWDVPVSCDIQSILLLYSEVALGVSSQYRVFNVVISDFAMYIPAGFVLQIFGRIDAHAQKKVFLTST